MNIVHTNHEETKEYTVNAVVKEIYTYGNIISLNLGTEVEFINTGRVVSKTIYCESRNNKCSSIR